MKQVSLFFLAAAVAATLSAAPAQETQKTTDMPAADMAAVLFAANQGEIEQATIAYPKLQNSGVKNFAQLLIDEHQRGLINTTNITKTNKIVPHEAAKDAVAVRDKSKQLENNFRTAQGDFDRNYLIAQIDEHQQFLDLLDNKMIPSSRGDLLTLMQTTRFMVKQHLERAKAILAGLPQPPPQP